MSVFPDSIIVPVSGAAHGTFGGERRPLSIATRGGLILSVAQMVYWGQGAQDGRPDAVCGGVVDTVGLSKYEDLFALVVLNGDSRVERSQNRHVVFYRYFVA